ncbi:MAG: GSCFA domain-containing protein [Alphaproteobacteria bacterium]|nr:GSCFA domain-containing protein [Alphaproteobacteria bacterium]
MTRSPYENREPKHFWRSAVSDAHLLTATGLYAKKFELRPRDGIATAGSCFAQHVANFLRKNGFSVLDVEPKPPLLDDEKAKAFGYGIYSARYGNIYTVRQLLQLALDAERGFVDERDVWSKDGRFFDALRPNVEPEGADTVEEVLDLRRHHLAKVKHLFETMDVFIFTLGLTEAWVRKDTGRVYPTAPGTIAGDYDPELFAFKNFSYDEIVADFEEFFELMRLWNPRLKVILTVSPVPLTATATDDHVLIATTYSKSVLRAVAGHLSQLSNRIDYFPSYELVASPWSRGFFYESNMRAVNPGGVAAVMRVFFEQHGTHAAAAAQTEAKAERRERTARVRERKRDVEGADARDGGDNARRRQRVDEARERQSAEEEAICEDVLLEAFAP